MAKTDWDSAAKLFALENERTGISVQDWCERNGLNYQSARRYLKSRGQSPSSKKDSRVQAPNGKSKSSKTAQTAQKPVRKTNAQISSAQINECASAQSEDDFDDDIEVDVKSTESDKPEYKGRDEKGRFLKGEYEGNPNPSHSFPMGHTHSLKHGGYATLIRNPEDLEVADEAEIIGLIAERRMYRARIASALRTINDLEGQIEEGIDEPDKISSMLRLIAAANNSIERCVGRVESLTKTLSSIRIDDVNGPRLVADHKRIVAAEGKLLAETDKLGRKSTAESVTFQLDW